MSTAQTSAALRAAGTSLQNSYSKPSGTDNSLGKDDFLKLMMAQATHQDPLNPMDSQGMMQQLTSMGSLEQLMNINKGLDSLGKVQADIARANTFSLLDKDVKVPGGRISLTEGSSPAMQFTLPREAETVKVSITDQSGQPIRSLDMGPHGPGSHNIQWDGRDEGGKVLPNGLYSYNVSAAAADSERVPVEMHVTGKVSGVRFDKGRHLLLVNGEEVNLSEVVEMNNNSSRLFGGREPQPLRQELRTRPPLSKMR
ncbi:MAG: flagellar hook assembly protein FlgD [Deltaproteobacteria bacterium]|nr:flagellar hook assembly protein FlgD [Deltaproteobacteria bacterium]